jgi:predicted RNase H-like HicB family nuclease
MAETIQTQYHPETTLTNQNLTHIFGIPVTVEYDDSESSNYFVISDNEINMYGVGDTVAEAEEDYKSVVLSYLEDLEINESKLGEKLKEHLSYLREKLSNYKAGVYA